MTAEERDAAQHDGYEVLLDTTTGDITVTPYDGPTTLDDFRDALDAAEAKLARVRALVEEWASQTEPADCYWRQHGGLILAALDATGQS